MDELEKLFDLYWGGKERRITGLTVRIIGVNFFAVVALIAGVVYLGQYHSILIESKLARFQTEIVLVTAAIAEGALEHTEESGEEQSFISSSKASNLAARLGATLDKRILIFDSNDHLIVDSKKLIEQNNVPPIFKFISDKERRLSNPVILKNTASWVASFFPRHNKLDYFSGVFSDDGNDYYNVFGAKQMNLSISAWQDHEGDIVLTAAFPIMSQKEIVGVVMLIGENETINEDLADMWFNVLNIFLVTLLITIFLSIYLSGVIARPLRILASAAENVRKGKLRHTEIPDMSDRHDEIGELSIVLRNMTSALWDRMDTIEAFAADVAHEIKNPLTSLKSAVETATIVKKKKDLDKLLSVIKHDADRLDRLITDISNASRLDAELSREVLEPVDLRGMLIEILDSKKNPLERDSGVKTDGRAMQDDVMITLDMPEDKPLIVLGSESRLTQVFQNLLANALSFSPPESSIRIVTTIKDKKIRIAVEDNGPGIPKNRLTTIFERFYTERPEHEEYGRHSGLGLSICKQIIAAHNGRIYAENRTDHTDKVIGARFVVVLNTI